MSRRRLNFPQLLQLSQLPQLSQLYQRATLLALLVPIFIAVGCDNKSQGEPAAAASEVSFAPVKFDEWGAKLASYPPDIVVVDMWATWCVSCLERFPHMVEMWARYRGKGVRFVSLNLDDHQDSQALGDALVLLKRFGAEFENYYMDENLMQAFERLNLIGIPAVVIYDREGAEAARLSGDNPNRQFTEADIETALQRLLGEA